MVHSPCHEVGRAGRGWRSWYAGPGPARSNALDAWLFPVDEGRRLRIADDEAGTAWWRTPEEQERAAMEQERAAKEEERAAKEQECADKEAALARMAELERELAALRRQ